VQVTEEVKFEPKVMMEKVDQRQTFHQAQLEHGDILVVQALPSSVPPSHTLPPACKFQSAGDSTSSLLGLVHDKRSRHHLHPAMRRYCAGSAAVRHCHICAACCTSDHIPLPSSFFLHILSC
jgi:hypothetical protein